MMKFKFVLLVIMSVSLITAVLAAGSMPDFSYGCLLAFCSGVAVFMAVLFGDSFINQ